MTGFRGWPRARLKFGQLPAIFCLVGGAALASPEPCSRYLQARRSAVTYNPQEAKRVQYPFVRSVNPAPTPVDQIVYQVSSTWRLAPRRVVVLIPPTSAGQVNLRLAESVKEFLATIPPMRWD
jgi:hypothetical protein